MSEARLLLRRPGADEIEAYASAEAGFFEMVLAPFEGKPQYRYSMEAVEPGPFPIQLKADMPANVRKREHLDKVEKAKAMLEMRGGGKVVLCRSKYTYGDLPAFMLFEALVEEYPHACVYLISTAESGTWIGASPELLLSKKGQDVRTVSLAGTRKKIGAQRFSPKEVEEQQLVTDYIQQCFHKASGLDQVAVEAAEVVEAGNLLHFQSRISAVAENNFKAEELLNDLHPTPAVCGSPADIALDFIQKHEAIDRSFYSGYFGLHSGDDFEYYLQLRCVQLLEHGYALYAGGGITRESDPESEWRETEDKMQTIESVLNRL